MSVNLGFKFKQFFVFFGEELFLGLYLYALLMIQFVPRLSKKEKLLLGCSSIKYRKTKTKSSHNGQSEEREITRRTKLGIKGKSSKLKNAEKTREKRGRNTGDQGAIAFYLSSDLSRGCARFLPSVHTYPDNFLTAFQPEKNSTSRVLCYYHSK